MIIKRTIAALALGLALPAVATIIAAAPLPPCFASAHD